MPALWGQGAERALMGQPQVKEQSSQLSALWSGPGLGLGHWATTLVRGYIFASSYPKDQ